MMITNEGLSRYAAFKVKVAPEALRRGAQRLQSSPAPHPFFAAVGRLRRV